MTLRDQVILFSRPPIAPILKRKSINFSYHSEEQKVSMDQFEPNYCTNLNQYEEVLTTSRKDIKDKVSESSIDERMIVYSPCSVNYED